ncbi:hypothetical protein D3C86_794090 [compost metagenome]
MIVTADAAGQLAPLRAQDPHHVATDEVSLDRDYALGQQAGALLLHGGHGPLIHLDFPMGGRPCQDPALAPFQRRGQRREQGPHPLAGGEATYHFRDLAGGDHHVDPGAACHVGGLQLGGHAAGPETADAVTGEGAQGVVYGLHLFDELGIRVGAGIRGKEPLLVSEQDQQIRIRQDGGAGGEVVVVPHLDLGGGHGVVLVDDGDDAMIEQGAQGVAGIEVTLPVLQIGAGQQHLADVQPVEVEQVLPYPDELGLAHRRQHLLVGQGRRQRRVPQVLTSGGDGAGGHQNDTVSVSMQGGTLPDQLHHVGTVETGRSPGEHAGAQFDDYGSVFHGNKGLEK